jgi:hypothetical protein
MSRANATIPRIVIVCCDWGSELSQWANLRLRLLRRSTVVSSPITNIRPVVQPPKWRPLQFLACQLGLLPSRKNKHRGVQVYEPRKEHERPVGLCVDSRVRILPYATRWADMLSL